jgi:predicted transcriptional regulator
MFGLMLLSPEKTNPVLIVQDLSPSIRNNQIPTLSTLLNYGQVSGGTSLLLPGNMFNLLEKTLGALILGTVVADRRRDSRVTKLRDRVVEEISINPGIHLRELRRHLDCAMGALQYHLRNLEGDSIITAIKMGNSKHFFLIDYSNDESALELTAQLRNPKIQTIIQECMSNGRITQAELSRIMDLDKSLISYYVGGLVDADILKTIKVFGREKPLVLTEWASLAITQLGLLVQ